MRIAHVIAPALLLALLAGCSFAAATAPSPPAIPSVTPLVSASATPALAPTSTPRAGLPTLAALAPEVVAARTAIAAQDYEGAVIGVAALAPQNADAAEVQAEAHLAWAQSLLMAPDGGASQAREAYDQLNKGLFVAPPDRRVHTELAAWQRAVEAFLNMGLALQRLDERKEAGASLAEQEAEIRLLLAAADSLAQNTVAFPHLAELETTALLAGGDFKKARAAGLAARSEQEALWSEGRALCARAVELWPESAPEAAAARTCVRGFDELLKPPTPTPTRAGSGAGTAGSQAPKLHVRLLNHDDNPDCISVRVTGTNTAGWRFSVDGLNLQATFQGGDARVCGLGGREVTISIRYPDGKVVRGGGGVPSKGSAILLGEWW